MLSCEYLYISVSTNSGWTLPDWCWSRRRSWTRCREWARRGIAPRACLEAAAPWAPVLRRMCRRSRRARGPPSRYPRSCRPTGGPHCRPGSAPAAADPARRCCRRYRRRASRPCRWSARPEPSPDAAATAAATAARSVRTRARCDVNSGLHNA